MIAFSNPGDALEWCLLVQEAMMEVRYRQCRQYMWYMNCCRGVGSTCTAGAVPGALPGSRCMGLCCQ